MRIGVLGGSFDPPHIGHLLTASDAVESLELDRLLVVPAFANPLKESRKPGDGAPTPAQRLEMVRLTFGKDARFEVSSMEIERGGLSYTVDTLETLSEQNPGAELTLLLGMDSLGSMEKWRRPQRIRDLARIAVFARRGDEGSLPAGMRMVTARRVDVSSTEIRARLAAGQPIRGFVADSVERYISTAKLYSSGGTTSAGVSREGSEENGNA